MTDPLRKKFPLLALIFLVLITVYATKYRTISGFNTASVPADVQIQNYINKIITPLMPVLQNIIPGINNSMNLYQNTPPPPISRPIIESLYSSYNSIGQSLSALSQPSFISTKNTVYILPILFREIAISIQNTANIIIKNPAFLSERYLKTPLPSYKTVIQNALSR